MFKLEELQERHLEGFEPQEGDIEDIPSSQFGNAAAWTKDGETFAICLTSYDAPKLWIWSYFSDQACKYPVAMHRNAKRLISGLLAQGYKEIRAVAADGIPGKWLERLGFKKSGIQQHDHLKVYRYDWDGASAGRSACRNRSR